MKCPNGRLIVNPTFLRRYAEDVARIYEDKGSWHLRPAIRAEVLAEKFADVDTDVPPTLIVPCGKCMICKTNKQQEWIFRLKKERDQALGAHFVTLTYNDAYLPFMGDDGKVHRLIDEVLTNAETHPTLVKSDLQKFLKRLRFNCEPLKLRYYAVGEYGGKYKRPHYHLLLFGLPSRTDHFDPLKEIDRAWQMGQVDIGDVNGKSINYVTSYMCVDKDAPFKGSEPQFCVMSRRPGIGSNFLDSEERKRFYVDQALVDGNAVVAHDGLRMPMPRYYKTKLFSDTGRFKRMSVTYDSKKGQPVTEYDLMKEMRDADNAHYRNRVLEERQKLKKQHHF